MEFYDRTVTRLLSRDHKTPINSYEPPIKRLQDSYQEITGLL